MNPELSVTLQRSLELNIELIETKKGFETRTLYHDPYSVSLTREEAYILSSLMLAGSKVTRDLIFLDFDNRGYSTEDTNRIIESLEWKVQRFTRTADSFEVEGGNTHVVEGFCLKKSYILGSLSHMLPIQEGQLVLYRHHSGYYMENIATKDRISLTLKETHYMIELLSNGYATLTGLGKKYHHFAGGESHTVLTNMWRLRKKLEEIGFPDVISTTRSRYWLDKDALSITNYHPVRQHA